MHLRATHRRRGVMRLRLGLHVIMAVAVVLDGRQLVGRMRTLLLGGGGCAVDVGGVVVAVGRVVRMVVLLRRRRL